MTMFSQCVVRVEKDVITRVTRRLSGKGQLQVSEGQEVAPDEMLGNAIISAGFRTINLSHLLSVQPSDVEKYLARKIGQRIYKGELLARKKGWLPFENKVIVSPSDGILDFLNPSTGELKISFLPRKVDLPAGVYGVVEKMDRERGKVIIRTQVSAVHGLFGSGRSRDGILHIVGRRDSIVSKSAIEAKFEGMVLAGGSIFFKDTISSAISVGVTGIITGGVQASDFRGMAGGRLVFPRRLETDIGISIVVCEGFGSIPLGDDIYTVLSEHEGKFVFMDGNHATLNLPVATSASITKIKNTKLSPLEDYETNLSAVHDGISGLTLGESVRIIGSSSLGQQGKIIKIDNSRTLLPSKISVFLATVETASRKLKVPVENLQLIM